MARRSGGKEDRRLGGPEARRPGGPEARRREKEEHEFVVAGMSRSLSSDTLGEEERVRLRRRGYPIATSCVSEGRMTRWGRQGCHVLRDFSNGTRGLGSAGNGKVDGEVQASRYKSLGGTCTWTHVDHQQSSKVEGASSRLAGRHPVNSQYAGLRWDCNTGGVSCGYA